MLNGCSTTIEKGEVKLSGMQPVQFGKVDVDQDDQRAGATYSKKAHDHGLWRKSAELVSGPFRTTLEKVGMVFQNFELFPHLTVVKRALAQEKVLKRDNARRLANLDRTSDSSGTRTSTPASCPAVSNAWP